MTDFLFLSGADLPGDAGSEESERSEIFVNSRLKKNKPRKGIHIYRIAEEYDIYLVGNPVLKKGFESVWNTLDPERILADPKRILWFYQQLSGICGILIVWHAVRKLIFVSDPLGLIPVFIYQHGNISALFSKPGDLASMGQLRLSWDEDAIQSYVCNGHFINHGSWWKEVKRVKASSVLLFDESSGTWSDHRYWSWKELVPANQDRKEFREESRDIFHRHIRELEVEKHRNGVALSGGRDSRWLFFVMNQYHRCGSFSFGIESSPDLEIAKSCANHSGNSHQEFRLRYENWYEDRVPSFLSAGGMLTLDHFHEGAIHGQLSGSYDAVFTGFFGGFSPRRGYVRLSDDSARSAFAFFPEDGSWKDDFYNDDSLHSYLIDQKMTNLAAHHLYQLSRHFSLATPFYHMEWIMHFYARNQGYWQEQYDYTKTIVDDLPDVLSSLPWQKTGFPLNAVARNTFWTTTGLNYLSDKIRAIFGQNRSMYDYIRIKQVVKNKIDERSGPDVLPVPCYKGASVREQIHLLSALTWMEHVRKIRSS